MMFPVTNGLPVGYVNVGTPPQALKLMLDTGSFWPILYNRSCTTCATNANLFIPEASDTFVNLEIPSRAEYGAGNVSGFMAKDIFSLAGHHNDLAMFPKWKFSLINKVQWIPSQHLSGIQASGILGLSKCPPGFQSQPTYGNITSCTLIQSGILKLNQIAFWSPKKYLELPGLLQVGGHDLLPSGDGKEITWTPNLDKALWVVAIDDVLVNGQSTNVCGKTHNCQALMDTGGSVVMFGNTIPKQPVEIDCSSNFNSTLPTLSLVINGLTMSFTPEDYVVRMNKTFCQSLVYSGQQPVKRRGVPDKIEQYRRVDNMKVWNNDLPVVELDFGVVLSSVATLIFDYQHDRMGFLLNK